MNPQNCSPDAPKARRNPLVAGLLSLIAVSTLAMAAYSVHVAVRKADPQETVVLGQTRLATGSPAGLRILVRELPNTAPFEFEYSPRARYPLRVQTPATAVYEYYQPANRAQAPRAVLEAVRN